MKGVKGFQKGNPGGAMSAHKRTKTLEKEALLEVMKKKIDKVWGELIDKKIELAQGIYVLKPIVVDGKVVDVKVYKKEPDGDALEYLFERRVGKIKDEVEFSGGLKFEDVPEELQEKVKQFQEFLNKKK